MLKWRKALRTLVGAPTKEASRPPVDHANVKLATGPENEQAKELAAAHKKIAELEKQLSVTSASPAPPAPSAPSPSPAPPARGDTTGGWTAKGWLLSLAPEVSDVVAAALGVSVDGADEFAALRSLSDETVAARLTKAGLPGLVPVITRGVGKLREQAAATGAELNSKFSGEQGTFELAFGSTDTFYGGLEAMIGPPLLFNGKLDESMKQEHTARADSSLEFTSSNGVTTTSATEWEVAMAPQAGQVYPDRASFAPDDARRRAPQAIEELLPAMEERNKRLEANKQTPMVMDELIAAKLYTGPMYHKYNLVLRSFSGVAFLKQQFERDCKGNLYATTIHGINSAVIKLSKLQVACPVYRGSTRAVLPAQFWQKDDFGLSGGVEFGFTSTTVERAQALHYAQGQASLVFESQMGLIDRGADISWLSQYPHEREVLFGPLLGQQPLAARVAGGSLVVETRMSLNMMSLTLEQVLNKRFRLLKEMGAGMVMEVHAAFAGTGIEARMAELLRTKLDATVLEKAASYYNDDPNFMQTVQGMLQLKNEQTGLDAVAKLEDSDRGVREAAVQTLGKLPPEVLAAHAAAVLAKLEDSEWRVRYAAVQTLGQLPPEVLAAHAAAVVAKLEDSEGGVRRAAVETLGKLPPEELAAHAAAVVAKLEDSEWSVRRAAVRLLGQLPPEVLAAHAATVLAKLEHSDAGVREVAVQTLGQLPPEVLAAHAAALKKVAEEDKEARVQIAAHGVLHKIEPAAGHIDAVVAKLEDSDWGVREVAVQTLGQLPSAVLTKYKAALQKVAEEDEDPDVRSAAAEALSKLQASE